MNDPMPLENLPGYLQSIRGKNINPDQAPVVDIGKIVERPRPFRGALALSLFIAVFSLGLGALEYMERSKVKSILVVLDDNNANLESVKEIIAGNGVKVISIEQNPDHSFEAKVSGNIKSLIEKLRSKGEVKDAWLHDGE